MKFTKLFSTLITILQVKKVACEAYFVFNIKSIESSMEGRQSFRGFLEAGPSQGLREQTEKEVGDASYFPAWDQPASRPQFRLHFY